MKGFPAGLGKLWICDGPLLAELIMPSALAAATPSDLLSLTASLASLKFLLGKF